MSSIRDDLRRPHPHAFERVGFVTAKVASIQSGLMILAEGYLSLSDELYLPDSDVGAMIGSEAFRQALEVALLNQVGVFHVHMHLLKTQRLWFSSIDTDEQDKFVPDFFKVNPRMPHGALVLSPSRATGRVWISPRINFPIREVSEIGSKLQIDCIEPNGQTTYK